MYGYKRMYIGGKLIDAEGGAKREVICPATAKPIGEVQVNGVRYNIDLPHGGIKQSGVGYDCSHPALDDYLITKRVTTALR